MRSTPKEKVKAKAVIEITRPANSVFAGFAAVIGSFIGGFSLVPAVAAATVTVFATGAGNAVNDYFDAEIDAVNRPDRPIPSGRLSEREALGTASSLFLLAFFVVLSLPPLAIGIGVLNLTALVTYSSHLKRVPLVGNLVVAYLTGSAFLFGGAAVGGVEYTAVLFVLGLLATLGREIVKDVEDIEGDREEGARTLPIIWGETRSLMLASVSVLVAVGLSPLPYIKGIFGFAYLVGVVPGDLILLAGSLISWKNPSKGQKLLKVGMFAAMGAFVLGRVVA
ncbi:MAG: geranylgeranylglycerol-phosphate geranylgeranyltransferase [Halobacteria archaeon]|nr:geranylgeranylglycerol-phosphate geranylgeranyltransferase [Halobacteria archaeon]